MAAKGLPKDPLDSDRYKAYHGIDGFKDYRDNDAKRLSHEQINMVIDILPKLVDEDSLLIVETLPGDLRKLTFKNAYITIICDPRVRELQLQAREQMLAESFKPLELTRSKSRSLIARTMRYLRHHGYM